MAYPNPQRGGFDRGSNPGAPYGGHRGGHGRGGGSRDGRFNGNDRRNGGDRQNQYGGRDNREHQTRGGGHHSNRSGGPRHGHSSHSNQEKPISAYVKASFFENPWESLERQYGERPQVQRVEVMDAEPTFPPPEPSQPVVDVPLPPADSSASSATRLGLSLPPPKQAQSSTGSKLAGFLSRLPPPKSMDQSSKGDSL